MIGRNWFSLIILASLLSAGFCETSTPQQSYTTGSVRETTTGINGTHQMDISTQTQTTAIDLDTKTDFSESVSIKTTQQPVLSTEDDVTMHRSDGETGVSTMELNTEIFVTTNQPASNTGISDGSSTVRYVRETPVDEFAEWRGKGVECATYFHGKPEYLYLFETLEIFCICYNRDCPETTTSPETPVDEFAEWRGKGVECATYFHGKPEYLYLFETLEIFCICYNRNCPETTYPDNVTHSVNNREQTTSMWFGKGQECLERVFNVYKLNLTREEYLCLCFDACTEKQREDNLKEIRNTGTTNKRHDVELAFLGIFYALIIICGILGNLLVIVTVLRFMGKGTVTNIYICNLAVADLLVVLICVPFKIAETMRGEWLGTETGCKVAAWLYFCFFMSSVFTLTCMSVERFLVICYPMHSHIISSMRRTTVIIILCWVFAVGLSAPTYYVVEIHAASGYCLVDRTARGYSKRAGFYSYIFVVVFLIPVLVMSFAYVRTMSTLWASIKRLRLMKNQHTVTKNGSVKGEKSKISSSGRVQVIRVLITVLVVFVVCWAPYLLIQLIHNTSKNPFSTTSQNITRASTWLNLLTLANSCLNPILYGVLSRKYREGFIRCLKCDNTSMKKKNGSVLTATSSASGSVQKAKRKASSDSVSTSGVTNGVAMKSVSHDKIERDRESSSNGKVSFNKAFIIDESSSCIVDNDKTTSDTEERFEDGGQDVTKSLESRGENTNSMVAEMDVKDKVVKEEKLPQNQRVNLYESDT